eukprot:scaffold27284_cov152-Isochrysis_galbana.AAC.2
MRRWRLCPTACSSSNQTSDARTRCARSRRMNVTRSPSGSWARTGTAGSGDKGRYSFVIARARGHNG